MRLDWRFMSALAMAGWVIAQSLWILLARPDPPPAAVTATRRSRTTIAFCSLIFGIAYSVSTIVLHRSSQG